MRKHITALLILSIGAAFAQADVLIRNASVVDVEHGTIRRGQELRISGGKIVAIGPSLPRAAESARVFDAGYRYVIPALWDMHAHPATEADLKLFVANGVGGVRIMAGTAEHLAWRARIWLGEMTGPRLLLAGPIIEGLPPPELSKYVVTEGRRLVRSEDDGIAEVRRQKAAGFDYIKVYNNVPAEAYRGVVAEAARQSLPVVGHVPFSVGLSGALHAQQASIEHLRGYIEMLVPKDAPIQPAADLRSRALAWQYADLRHAPELVTATRNAGTWQTPTLSTQVFFLPSARLSEYLATEDAQYMEPLARAMLVDRASVPWLNNFGEDDFERATRSLEKQYALLRSMHEKGVPILAGTDMMPWGFSLHGELELLTHAGLSNREALKAATVNAARFARLDSELGRVAAGYAADLVILDADPLLDIRNTRAIRAVMLRGELLERADLDRLLSEARTQSRVPATEQASDSQK